MSYEYQYDSSFGWQEVFLEWRVTFLAEYENR
jgi:hypothetical protein